MTLKEFLEENKSKYKFKIGAASSFFYIGNYNERAVAKINESNSEFVRFYKKQIKNTKVAIAGINNKLNKTEVDTRNLLKLKKLLSRYEKFMNSRKDFLDRPVKEFYQSVLDPTYMIVVLDGLEIGRFWFESEMVEKPKTKKNKRKRKGK